MIAMLYDNCASIKLAHALIICKLKPLGKNNAQHKIVERDLKPTKTVALTTKICTPYSSSSHNQWL